MSLSVAVGANSLVQLGIGISDVQTICNLALRVGNWYTAASGDEQLLIALNDDVTNILRKGAIDYLSFNKRWRKQARFLVNGRPWHLTGQAAQEISEPLNHFSATMVCVTAVLDEFNTRDTSMVIMKKVLQKLLGCTEGGEDVLKAQLTTRLSAWRSFTAFRGLANEAKRIRANLIANNVVMSGFMHRDDSHLVIDFLVWFLGRNGHEFFTVSSDIAGMAFCLCKLGFEILNVEGPGFGPRQTPCTVRYKPEGFMHGTAASADRSKSLSRATSTTVSLYTPEECFGSFPLSPSEQNICRSAWKSGTRAAKYVGIGVLIQRPNENKSDDKFSRPDRRLHDVLYSFIDKGKDSLRSDSDVYFLARELFPVENRELLRELQHCLKPYFDDDGLEWLMDHFMGHKYDDLPLDIHDDEFEDRMKIMSFCTLQAFFMGYYYSVFLRLVDTSTLEVKTCDGQWGYRCANLMKYVQQHLTGTSLFLKGSTFTFTRAQLFPILSRFFLDDTIEIPAIVDVDVQSTWCVGIISKRTLLANSLLGKCASPDEIAGFTLLDVDVGGVPRDTKGIVRCGVPDFVSEINSDVNIARGAWVPAVAKEPIFTNLSESEPPQDLTFHIEPDWSGNPDTALVCTRYNGRRLTTISTAESDAEFCFSYIEPTRHTGTRSCLEKAHAFDIQDFMTPDDFGVSKSIDPKIPILFQALDRPLLRYTAFSVYRPHFDTVVASDCVRTALREGDEPNSQPKTDHRSKSSEYQQARMVVSGMTDAGKWALPQTSLARRLVYEILTPVRSTVCYRGESSSDLVMDCD